VIFGVQSGEEVRTLEEHEAEVTAVCLNPKNPYQIISASLDRTIKFWDIEKATVTKTFSVGLPIHFMQIDPAGDIAYIATEKSDSKDKHILWRFRFETEETKILFEGERKFYGIALSASGNTLAAIFGTCLYMWKTTEGNHRVIICKDHHMNFTSIAIHPQDEFIATGNTVGEITLWYHKASKAGGKTKSKTLLWHTQSVVGLSFTLDGVYLLSGGPEGVLVTWQLETGIKQFLPGMGSKFTGISVSSDASYYCLALKDNSVKIINAISTSVEKSIQRFKHATKGWNNPLITIEPRNHLLVSNSLNGSIQFYNPLIDRFSYELIVALPSAENIKRASDSRIDFFAFSKDGVHLATVEFKAGITIFKIWFLKAQENKWLLNTSVEGPHQDALVTSLSSHPDVDMFVTTSVDGTFKVWTKIALTQGQASSERKRAAGQTHSWVCRSVGFHAKQPVTCSAFSDDGSILAIGYPDSLTLWNPHKNSLLHTLPHFPGDAIKRVIFISNSPFVVTCTEQFMYVWNLLNSCVWWSYRAHVTNIVAEPNSSRFVVSVTEKENFLLLFKHDSPIPLHTWKLNEPPASITCFSKVGLDVHQSLANGSIVYVNRDQTIHVLEEYNIDAQMNALRISSEVSLDDNQRKPLGEEEVNLLEKLYGQTKAIHKKGKKATVTAEVTQTAPADSQRALSLLNAPSHILPPLSSLYSSFMEILVLKQEPVQPASTQTTQPEKKEKRKPIQNEREDDPSLELKQLEGLNSKFIEDMSVFFKSSLKISVENGKPSKKTPRKAESLVESSGDSERNSKKVRNSSQEMNGGSHITVEEMLEEEENAKVNTPRRSARKVPNGKSAKKSESNGVESPPLSQEEPTSPEPLSHRKRKLKTESKQNES